MASVYDAAEVGARPLISIIMASYNRAHTIERAIQSITKQNYTNYELIIVDDGSTDNTLDVLSKYQDSRIRIIKCERNKGVTAAKNLGLNAIDGEWFTFLDSDDEMEPEALKTLLSVLKIDPKIDAITCNCIDSVTGNFTGQGIDKDQYIDENLVALKFRGEHWGLTKTSLLGVDRFNEELPGWENILWYKINSRATRYYIHKGLRIYHTEGEDRISKSNASDKSRTKEEQAKIYKTLLEEESFLKRMARLDRRSFEKMCIKGVVISMACEDSIVANSLFKLLASNKDCSPWSRIIASAALRGGYIGGKALFWVMSCRQNVMNRIKESSAN